ncbi:hypothetical protein NPIL_296541 [Nephila pilipes]|uniref:Uncharacterized protein n=1 Tax=Nephila pilipes TaxID=299642 RepID=A0A8X6IY80_NEPPI|nr:hypothetical protein NPIL_296541 [Nephila pilipes]
MDSRCLQLPIEEMVDEKKGSTPLLTSTEGPTSRYVLMPMVSASVRCTEPGTAASAPAAAYLASPYAGPVAPVVNHVAPVAPLSLLQWPSLPQVFMGVRTEPPSVLLPQQLSLGGALGGHGALDSAPAALAYGVSLAPSALAWGSWTWSWKGSDPLNGNHHYRKYLKLIAKIIIYELGRI